MPTRALTANIYIGVGWGIIATIGTALEISRVKKLAKPKADAALSTWNILAFDAITTTKFA